MKKQPKQQERKVCFLFFKPKPCRVPSLERVWGFLLRLQHLLLLCFIKLVFSSDARQLAAPSFFSCVVLGVRSSPHPSNAHCFSLWAMTATITMQRTTTHSRSTRKRPKVAERERARLFFQVNSSCGSKQPEETPKPAQSFCWRLWTISCLFLNLYVPHLNPGTLQDKKKFRKRAHMCVMHVPASAQCWCTVTAPWPFMKGNQRVERRTVRLRLTFLLFLTTCSSVRHVSRHSFS